MKADILNYIGPFLNNRSHTFTIRTYEDVQDIHGTITLKAYLEAVVQQVPDFVDSTNEAFEYFQMSPTQRNRYLDDVTYPNNKRIGLNKQIDITSTNQRFGRKFKIISFRWLNESDL